MLPLVNDAYQTLKPYVPGKPVSETERELGIKDCIKLASNENPYGPSPRAIEAMAKAIGTLHDYPDGGAFYLKQKLAALCHVDEQQFIIGNGTNELIEMVVRTCLRPGENLLYASPSFIVYKLVAQAMERDVRDVPLQDMRFDLPALADAVDARTKIIFIANPNNPTGTYVTAQEMKQFLRDVPEHVLIVLDEAYFEYAAADDYPDGMTLLDLRERFLVMRTFSKCYGLAGARIGYAVGSPLLIDYLNRGRQPFNVNTLAQVGALAALDDVAFVKSCRNANRHEMMKLEAAFAERGWRVTPSQANFLLVDFDRDGHEVFTALLQRGVIVRPVGNYGMPTAQRITVGTPEQNERLLKTLDQTIAAAPRGFRS